MGVLRRWAATIALSILLSAVCVAAGLWQWSRHADRSAAVELVVANYQAEPVEIGELVGEQDRAVRSADVWHPVLVTGRYLPSSVLLRNRPVNGQAGFHVLSPVLIDEGRLAGSVLVVDRGWVPTASDGSSADVVPPPDGPVELVVRLRADEAPSTRDAPAGQVQAISVEQVRVAAGSSDWPPEATVAGYGALVSENGGRPVGLGALPRPSTELGSHLSYAFQWWVFALGALVGCVVLIVREQRETSQETDDELFEPGRSVRPARPARSGRRTAEEEEDALLDAQELSREVSRPS